MRQSADKQEETIDRILSVRLGSLHNYPSAFVGFTSALILLGRKKKDKIVQKQLRLGVGFRQCEMAAVLIGKPPGRYDVD
jgi:hypothetical protein